MNDHLIREKLVNDEITGQEAISLIMDSRTKQKPWNTAEWQVMRDGRIGVSCD